MSAASMGKALVIFATSCAALSSQPTRTSTSTPSPIHHHGKGRFRGSLISHRNDKIECTVALNYRDSDEDQPASFQFANDKALASAIASNKKVNTSASTPTRWISIPEFTSRFPQAGPQDEQQENMDEYLEYVEKRYSRMNRRSTVSKPLEFHFPGKSLIFTYFFHSESPATAPTEKDPLDVLGLGSLASERLRQRLHVPREFRDEMSSLFSSTETAVLLLSPLILRKLPSNTSANTEIGGRLASSVSLSFVSQLQLMMNSFKRLTAAFVTALKIMANFSSRVMTQILDNGGIRHTVRMASVASFAILLMFRPLFKGALKNTPLHGPLQV